MKDMLKLFFDPKKNQYYFIPEKDYICNSCKNVIFRTIIFRFNWGKKKSFMQQFCLNCINEIDEIKNINPVKIKCIATIVDTPPKFSYLTFIRPPDLSNFNSDISTFEASQMRYGKKAKVNDRTIYANRKLPKINTEKAKRITEERIDELNTPITSVNKADSYLENMLEFTPQIEGSKTKLLEGKK